MGRARVPVGASQWRSAVRFDAVADADALEISIEMLSDVTFIWLHGEIDLLTIPQLSAALGTALAGAPAELVLDLQELTFIGCGGVDLLIVTARRAAAQGTALRIVPGPVLNDLLAVLDDPNLSSESATVDRLAANEVVAAAQPAGPDPGVAPLKVIVDEPTDGVLMLKPSGDINSANAQFVADTMLAAYSAASRLIVLDLCKVGRLSSEGVNILLLAQRTAAESGVALVLTNAHPAVRRVLELADPKHRLQWLPRRRSNREFT